MIEGSLFFLHLELANFTFLQSLKKDLEINLSSFIQIFPFSIYSWLPSVRPLTQSVRQTKGFLELWSQRRKKFCETQRGTKKDQVHFCKTQKQQKRSETSLPLFFQTLFFFSRLASVTQENKLLKGKKTSVFRSKFGAFGIFENGNPSQWRNPFWCSSSVRSCLLLSCQNSSLAKSAILFSLAAQIAICYSSRDFQHLSRFSCPPMDQPVHSVSTEDKWGKFKVTVQMLLLVLGNC